MKKFLMIASAAAMAVAMPAMAKPDKAGGGGGGDFKAEKMKGGGGGDFKPQKMKGGDGGFKQAEKAQKQQFKAAERSMKGQDKAFERAEKSRDKQAERAAKSQEKASERFAKSQEKMRERQFGDNDRLDRDDDGRFERSRFGGNSGAFCPPGLAKKDNGCMPPGQAKKMDVGQRFQSDRFRETRLPDDFRDLFSDNDDFFYRYDENGYIYRVDRDTNLVSGLIPLLGGGFQVGQVLPAGFDVYNVPLQFRDRYFDTDELAYRFGDNAIYQVDPQTRVIQNVVALLTGDRFSVGQPMPAGYDMYNVPLEYRDQYFDTDESLYRYADGNIYQVDPTTQIVQAVIQALI